jgi:alpha-beta hydrolase superfamily lysophospholipase
MSATADPTGPDTIVLVHGLWLNPLSWEKWIDRYRSKGYNVLAPAWPGMEGDVEQVRSNTEPYERLGVQEIADHYERIIRELDKPPIIMGHSFGGLITEILLDRGLGAAGVAISPAPIKGILALPFSSLKVASVALKNPANRHKAVTLTPGEFHYGFTNTLSDNESNAAYKRYAIPGPGRVLFQAAFANFNPNAATRVHTKNGDRAPLLLIGAGQDHTVPASVTRSAFKIQRKSSSPTELKEYPERSHYTFAQDGWEDVADYALEWATEHAKTPAAVPA